MEGYFPYQDYVTGKDFIGREDTVDLLVHLLERGENILIYDAPHTGKTSLVRKAIFNLKKKQSKIQTCFISLGNIRTGEEFLLKVGNTLIRSLCTTATEYETTVRTYLEGCSMYFDPDVFKKTSDILTSITKARDDDYRKVLSMAVDMTDDLFRPGFTVIIDEFQTIARLDDAEKIFKAFREVFSREGKCNWLITGSKVNEMTHIFKERTIFSGLIKQVELPRVDTETLCNYIIHTFNSTGKVISREFAAQYIDLLKGDLWYINHLMSICDSLTRGYVTESVIKTSLENLLFIHNPKFRAWIDSLTGFQINCLKAILDGKTHLTSSETISRYGLNSSANTIRVRDALKKKELIAFNESDEPYIIDPLFELWLRTCYFNL